MEPVILASGSPRRRELLETAGIPFTVDVSDTDESTELTSPDDVVRELSRRKCLDVAGRVKKDAFVLGADTVVAVNGVKPDGTEGDPEILGKPSDGEDAARMLRSLQGRSHLVYTGVTLAERKGGRIERIRTEVSRTRVSIAPMTEEEIRAYVKSKEPMDKAGSYGIQGLFSRYIEKIDGNYSGVVGLPVSLVYRMLTDWDYFSQEPSG